MPTGAALANCQLNAWSPLIQDINDPQDAHARYRVVPLPPGKINWRFGEHRTDGQGRFEISCLIPGVEYRIRAVDPANRTPEGYPKIQGPLDVVIRVASGETKDLGDVRLADEAQFTAAAVPAPKGAAVKPAPNSKPLPKPNRPMGKPVVTGKVTLADGKPAAAAHVAVIATRIAAGRGGDLSPRGEVLGEATADAGGNYRLSLKPASSKTHRDAALIARQDGSAVGWKQFNLDARSVEESLTLVGQEPIRGRLVDIEGKPAAGVPLVRPST